MKDNRIMVANGNTVGEVTLSGDSALHPNFKNNKHYVAWSQFDENVSELCDSLKKEYLFVYGIPRGGVTLSTMVSHRLGIPMVSNSPRHWMLDWYHWRMRENIKLKSKCTNILIVDAICDTGRTLEYLIKDLPKEVDPNDYSYDIAVIDVDPAVKEKVDYYVNLKNPDAWLVYPWEVGSQELNGGL